MKTGYKTLLNAFALSLFSLMGAAWGQAAEITQKQALDAAAVWRGKSVEHLSEFLAGKKAKEVSTFRDIDDSPLFHIVGLSEGGFLVMAADDTVMPVLAFSDAGEFSDSADNPLNALLKRDVRVRLTESRSPGLQTTGVSDRIAAAKRAWSVLLSHSGVSTLGVSDETINDMRVEPLVQSRWGQSAIGGEPVFNRFTPNGYPCGCVATTGAQLMRYHEFLRSAVPASTFSVFVDNVSVNQTLTGGVYDWTLMPLTPAKGFSDDEADAIGHLCADVGIACRTSYADDGSGAYCATLAAAFTQTFGYADAKALFGSALTTANMESAVFSNIDAGFPVSLGVLEDGSNGHQLIADGYGYYDTTRYVHLNLGWNGTADAWYNLPVIDTGSGYTFDAVDDILFNVFPEGTGETVSGRVLNAAGNPVAGVTVTAGSGLSTVSDANGIYAFLLPSSATFTIGAQLGNFSARRSITTGKSASTSSTYNASTGSLSYTPGTGSAGSVWGVDLTLGELVSVTFDPLEGSVSEADIAFPLGAPYGALPIPVRNGWTFAGWYTAETGGSAVTASSVATLAVTHLYARWSQAYGAELNPDLTWSSGGDAKWIAVSDVTYDGISAMRSGDMPTSALTSESCWIQTTVEGPGTFRFSWLASSDSISFTINGTEHEKFSGSASAAWARKGYILTAGTKTLRWTFTRPFLLPGNGHGWLDAVTWEPTILTLSEPAAGFGHTGGEGSVTVSANVGWEAASSASWLIPDVRAGDSGESTLNYTVSANTDAIVRSAKLTVSGGGASVVHTVTQVPHRVSVAFHNEGSTETGTYTVGLTYGSLPVPTREGYTFMGWFTEPDGAGMVVAGGNPVTEEITDLYAAWVSGVKEITVTFNASSGSVSPATRVYTVGKPFTSFPTPTRSSYGFAGWYTGSGGTGERVWENSIVSASESTVTLYAHWVASTSLAYAVGPMLSWVFHDGTGLTATTTNWTTATGGSSVDGLGIRTRNGKINTTLTAQTSVMGPGIMTFAWKRANSASADTLNCSVNGTVYFTKTSTSWTTATMTCSEGEKSFLWAYKHGNSSSYNFYLDTVVWTPTILHVAQRNASFEHKGGTGSLTVESNVDWEATTEDDWITIGNVTATSITYTVAPLSGKTVRTGTITLKGGGAVQNVTITQLPLINRGLLIRIF